MVQNKVNDQLVKQLYSDNATLIEQALIEISETGNSNYIPMLIDVLHFQDNDEIKEKVITILSEIKHTDAVPKFIEAIEDKKYAEIKEKLVRACWENGLDFTNYFSTFIDLLINGEYMVAFEAYTVIENTEGHLSETSTDEYLHRLKVALPHASIDRQTLIHEIVQFLPSLIKI